MASIDPALDQHDGVAIYAIDVPRSGDGVGAALRQLCAPARGALPPDLAVLMTQLNQMADVPSGHGSIHRLLP